MNLKGDLSRNTNQNRERQETEANKHDETHRQVSHSDNEGNKDNYARTQVQTNSTASKYFILAAVIVATILAVLFLTNALRHKEISSNDNISVQDSNPYTEPIPSQAPKSGSETANADKLDASEFNGNLANYSKLKFTEVIATSMANTYDGSTLYYPAYTIDGLVSTSWQEGVDGYGIGETLTLKLSCAQDVEVLSFVMGSHMDKNYYEENGKPRQILFDFSDGSSFTYEFPQVSEQYTIVLNRPVKTSWISLTIVSAYPGTKFEDTAIAEIEAYNKSGVSTNSSSDCITETEYYSNGAISKVTKSYPKDNVRVIIEYYQDGTRKSDCIYYSDENYEITKYNDDGTTASYMSRFVDPYNGFVKIESQDYEYINGVLAKKTTIQHGETWISEYDATGNVIRTTHIDINGKTTVTEK